MGRASGQGRQQATVRFSAGDLVLLFTDGLVERRDEDVTQGEARLLHMVNSLTDGDLSAALAEAVARLRDPSRDDDAAVLAARRLA